MSGGGYWELASNKAYNGAADARRDRREPQSRIPTAHNDL